MTNKEKQDIALKDLREGLEDYKQGAIKSEDFDRLLEKVQKTLTMSPAEFSDWTDYALGELKSPHYE